MAAWFYAPDTAALVVLVALTGLTALVVLMALTDLADLHKNRLLVYQEPVLIAISGFGTQELLAVLPSKSDTETTQGQSCNSND